MKKITSLILILILLSLSLTSCFNPSEIITNTQINNNPNAILYQNVIVGNIIFSTGNNNIIWSGETSSSYNITNDYFTVVADDDGNMAYTYQLIIAREQGLITINKKDYNISVSENSNGTYNITVTKEN